MFGRRDMQQRARTGIDDQPVTGSELIRQPLGDPSHPVAAVDDGLAGREPEQSTGSV